MYIYILLIFFFTSLAGIIMMIGRKLVLLRNGKIVIEEEISFGVPHLDKVKHFTIKNIKKYEQIVLVGILRFYVRSTNFFKETYSEVKIKMKDRMMKNHIHSEKKEISKFLKVIGDYKHKIREIKHKIKKEENL